MSSHEPAQMSTAAPATEELAVLKMMTEWMREQQQRSERERARERFWRNVRVGFIALGMLSGPLYFLWLGGQLRTSPMGENYAAMVRIDGVIGADKFANAQRIVNSLELAFHDPKSKGVVVLINSPGGSPVQASIIHDRLVALRKRHPDKKVWAIGEDMLTSGAYFVAVGAPKICVDRSTLTGSIGVIRDGWGLDKAIARLGIERRVFTAGTAKNQLDTFLPLSEQDKRKTGELLDAVHEHFKSVVREGRGARLRSAENELFSGDLWTGEQAMALGLVDGLCTMPDLLAREYGVENVKDYTLPPSLLEGISRAVTTQVAQELRQQAQSDLMLLPSH